MDHGGATASRCSCSLSGVVLGAQKAIYESEPKVVTATIEAVDKDSRVVTLKTEAGSRMHVTAPPEMEGFNSLKVGDIVTAKYFEAVVVRLARPDSPAPSGTPTTSVRRKDDVPGSETMRERTVRAKVTAVDPKAPSLSVRRADGVERAMAVGDADTAEGAEGGRRDRRHVLRIPPGQRGATEEVRQKAQGRGQGTKAEGTRKGRTRTT